MTGMIVEWNVALPEGWGVWGPGQGAESTDDIAERLATNDTARQRVRDAVVGVDADLPLQRALLSAGVWVPNPDSGEAVAMVLVELTIPAEGGVPVGFEGFRQFASAPLPRRRGYKVFEHSVMTIDVPAGRAVLQRDVVAERRGPVTTTVQWTVFPGGTDEAIRIRVSTLVPALSDAIVRQGQMFASLLTVTVGPGERL